MHISAHLMCFIVWLSLQPQRKELKASVDARSAQLAKLKSKIDKVEDEVKPIKNQL